MTRFAKALLAAVALLAATIGPIERAYSAATTQTLHAMLCAPEPSVGTAGPRVVVNTSSTASPQPSYALNAAGCAVFANADIGFFLSQGFTYGPSTFVAQGIGITGSGTASVSTGITLPAYAQIISVVLEETAGNAVTGGLNISNAGGATGIASAVALAANATVTVADSALNAGRIYSPVGVPTGTAVNLAAVTSWNSAVVNISIIYLIY